MEFDIESNISFIEDKINALGQITDQEKPYTRIVFSKEFYDGRSWLNDQFKSLGLSISTDEAGNLVGLLKTNKKTEKMVIMGSHIDTVPSGGRFDGVAGVVSALCVMNHIINNNINLPFDLAVYDYLGEELNDWGTSCIGSRGIGGVLNQEILSRKNTSGLVLSEEIDKIGGNTKLLNNPLPITKNILACLELHIEQGKILEDRKIDIGVVRSIPSISRFSVTVKGQAGHSGTILMNQRSDALVTASEIISFVNKSAIKLSQKSNQHFVATIGKINVHPNSAAIIPGLVEMTIDLRATSKNSRQEFLNILEKKIAFLNDTSSCNINIKDIAFAPFVEMNKDLIQLFKNSASSLGLSNNIMDSGAGHDTAQLSRVVPAGMIFIPCKDGLSHCPEEYAEASDISKGTAVLWKVVEKLAFQNINKT
tara:strand:- start:315 stop:1583 length:1269 start_codon:yes stop_codon:yes gene_type:complete